MLLQCSLAFKLIINSCSCLCCQFIDNKCSLVINKYFFWNFRLSIGVFFFVNKHIYILSKVVVLACKNGKKEIEKVMQENHLQI